MFIKSLTLRSAIVSTLALSLIAAVAADKKIDASKLPPAADKKGVTYEADIKPIHEKSCFKFQSRIEEAIPNFVGPELMFRL